MLSTDRQTDKQTNQHYQKHNLLCQGGNNNNKWIYEKYNICYAKYCYKMKIFSISGWGGGSGQ